MKRIKILLAIVICIFNCKIVNAETLSNHSTMSHTKSEIIEKYNSSKSQFNYNNSVYQETPATSIPYKEGSLKNEVENDVLNHLNFYRWLAGLNSLSINTSRQSANQKGALILAINKTLSHYPTKPNGMNDNFYNEGYSACGSKSGTWQGNISNGYRIDQTPEAFITDNTNVQNNVAHRSSLLNPNAKQVSFGYVNKYATMSIHYNSTNSNPDSYTPWPPAGYFPIEAMDQTATTNWSIYLGNYSMTTSTRVVLTSDNNQYIINRNNLFFTDYSKNMYYMLPSELKNQITKNSMFISGKRVNVRIENLSKSGINYTINYDTKFFSVSDIKVEKITLDKTNITIEEGEEEDLIPTITPSEAIDKNIEWTSSDNSIATIENGRVKGIKAGKITITAKTSNNKSATCEVTIKKATPGVLYSTHIQSYGWQKYVADGKISGTTGESKRLEAIKIKLKGIELEGSIEYKTHIETYGWEKFFTKNNNISGTEGEAKRLEAIKIRLLGEVANHYDVYYRVHAQSFGWLGWAKNGEESGTAGYAKRLEGIEIKLIEKGKTFSEYNKENPFISEEEQTYKETTKVYYTTHVQTYGWQEYVHDEEIAGTTGEAKRLEAIKLKLEDQEYKGNIEYRTHIEKYGWEEKFKKNGEISGTSGEAKRLEAIEIKLTGEIEKHYDIYYRVHAQKFGWLGWAKNGEKSGTAGFAYRLEAIEIKLIEKGQEFSEYGKEESFQEQEIIEIKDPPKVFYTTHVEKIGWQDYVSNGEMSGTEGEAKRLEAIKIKLSNQKYTGNVEYKTHIQTYGWEQEFKKNDEMSGTSGEAKRLEAIEIKLTGEMEKHYDIYYRVHAQTYGWLAWAKNGEKSGTAGYAKRLEGIEIILVNKGEEPTTRDNQDSDKAFIEK